MGGGRRSGGGDKERRRPLAASARGPPQAGREWPDANPINLQDPTYVGVASMNHQSQPGFTRIRTPYVPDAEAARIAEETANLTADPFALLEVLLGPRIADVDLTKLDA
ncbi:hypothetical protein PV729_22835 [Streptomyces europaeiscabiei]|uniref:Uncharacterized protein n=1 Tax=Streptomyces europaeiscabiei TaxID=146819 RepID=A0ABU4NK78_9ACTN|nr:hypothetical protein [Streptomyces europaeiscabiei]MDX3544883.1 hypothetical protein [Streptomyces europaeiscabiei]MDX3554571.1 hypothetical protein [Streptomyces europaeiscabiei]MDX3702527.1 hypothetical protein [Streptomyces europaeiscabiei]